MDPTATLPKFSGAGAMLNWPAGAAVPMPVEGTVNDCELEALLTNVRDPDAVPLLWGLKATLRETLCPAASVIGNDAPFRTN